MALTATIAKLRAQKTTLNVGGEILLPSPLSPERVAALRLPGGSVPPSELLEWLAFDASWFGILRPGTSELAVRTVREILAAWAEPPPRDDDAPPQSGEDVSTEEVLAYFLGNLPEPGLADKPAIELTYTPGSQEHVLVLDGDRVRVLGCEKRFEFWWKYESLDELVTHWFGLAKR